MTRRERIYHNAGDLEMKGLVLDAFVHDPRELDGGQVMVELSKGQGFGFHVEAMGHATKRSMEEAMPVKLSETRA